MSQPHPWRSLGNLTSVRVYWQEMPGLLGVTDGRDIWLNPRQLQVERRCTLAHELEHLRRGHDGCQTPAEEQRVRRAAARRLLPDFGLVLKALDWSAGCPIEAADELWVDRDTFHARIEGVSPREREALDRWQAQ